MDEEARILERIAEEGYAILPRVLEPRPLAAMRAELERQFEAAPLGRNVFEGARTKRINTLIATNELFAELAVQERVLALLDHMLLPNYLLTAAQAIWLGPGEKAQPLHADDGHYPLARPRPPVSIAAIWAISDFTPENGGTLIIPRSHLWDDEPPVDAVRGSDYRTGRHEPDEAPGRGRSGYELVEVAMPAGSFVIFPGTLWHGGGANRSRAPRLAVTMQYCQPWARQVENFSLSVPRAAARGFPERLKAMIGYSVHPPLMGNVMGRHPMRVLTDERPIPGLEVQEAGGTRPLA